jgi:hypothetical protein
MGEIGLCRKGEEGFWHIELNLLIKRLKFKIN